MKRQTVLGLGGFDHNGSAALVRDGRLVAFLEAERVTRRKHTGFTCPKDIDDTLSDLGIGQVDHVALADAKYVGASKDWLDPWLDARFPRATRSIHLHHRCHTAASFATSPFDEALVVSIDGRGDGLSSMALKMRRDGPSSELMVVPSPSSLGRLWSATGGACGLGDQHSAGKVMAWAALGQPTIYERLRAVLDLLPDGGFRFHPAPDDPSRWRDKPRLIRWLESMAGTLVQDGLRNADLAASVQMLTEVVILHMVTRLVEQTGLRRLCLGGGVALNGLTNERLLREGHVDKLHIPFAPDDRGLSLGAAALAWAEAGGTLHIGGDSPFLGPSAAPPESPSGFRRRPGDRIEEAAELLVQGAILGVFVGRDEAGPRALGNRSILASPRSAEMAHRLNARVKCREAFRPFGCSILEHRTRDWLKMEGQSPYMLRIAPVRPDRRADVPAVVHVDGTTRPQTVTRDSHPLLAGLLEALERRGHPPLLLNTSFNGRGEPIVHHGSEAMAMASRMGLDGLLTEDQLLVPATLPSSVGS
jgi:carbamoyltransferase